MWDTGIATHALGEAGYATGTTLRKTADWLLSKEVRRKGDWSIKRPDTEPSGWYFEFANEFYPDIDDTAMVLLALMHAKASDPERQSAAELRAIRWLIGMQSAPSWGISRATCFPPTTNLAPAINDGRR